MSYKQSSQVQLAVFMLIRIYIVHRLTVQRHVSFKLTVNCCTWINLCNRVETDSCTEFIVRFLGTFENIVITIHTRNTNFGNESCFSEFLFNIVHTNAELFQFITVSICQLMNACFLFVVERIFFCE